MPEFAELGKLARELEAPVLVANRVGNSWANYTNGGSVVYGRDGNVLAQANREGHEEILLHDLKAYYLPTTHVSLHPPP